MVVEPSVRQAHGDDRAERQPWAERDVATPSDDRPDQREGARSEKGPDHRLPGDSRDSSADDRGELDVAEGELSSARGCSAQNVAAQTAAARAEAMSRARERCCQVSTPTQTAVQAAAGMRSLSGRRRTSRSVAANPARSGTSGSQSRTTGGHGSGASRQTSQPPCEGDGGNQPDRTSRAIAVVRAPVIAPPDTRRDPRTHDRARDQGDADAYPLHGDLPIHSARQPSDATGSPIRVCGHLRELSTGLVAPAREAA